MRLYSSALENLNSVDLPDVVRVRVGLLSNRAAAWMMMGEAREGAEDCALHWSSMSYISKPGYAWVDACYSKGILKKLSMRLSR